MAYFVLTAGDDTFTAPYTDDTVEGGDGNDVIRGGKGKDVILGEGGHDYLRGDDGDDYLKGGDGDDQLYGNQGDDVLDGGAGWDRASYAVGATGGVTVDLSLSGVAQYTGQGWDTLISIEHLSGTQYDDKLLGDDGDNWIWGGSDGAGTTGNDEIHARDGNDLVEVGAGDHTLDGGDGIDTLSFYGNATDISSAGVKVSLGLSGAPQSTGQGTMDIKFFENLSGSLYGDTLEGDGGDNMLAGDGDADLLSGGDGDDLLFGDGRVRVDTHGVGTSGEIGRVDDIVSAITTGGNDTLEGGDGKDTLYGGTGVDVLIGGYGDDVFMFGTTGESTVWLGPDVIVDLEKTDLIDISAIDADWTTVGDDAFTLVGAFSGTAGEAVLDYDPVANITTLSLDTNGDAAADMIVDILGKWTGFTGFVL